MKKKRMKFYSGIKQEYEFELIRYEIIAETFNLIEVKAYSYRINGKLSRKPYIFLVNKENKNLIYGRKPKKWKKKKALSS